MTGTFSAAVFDMDGLLLDSERPICNAWLQAAAEVGVPLTEAQFLTVVGRNERDGDAILLETFDGDAALLAQTRQRADALLDQRFGQSSFPLKPGVKVLLDALQTARVPCAVASSTARREVQRRLGNAGLLDYFAAINGGDEVQRGKPAPDLYLLAASRLRVAPQHALAFEDSDHGARAAIAAGLSVVVVPDLKPAEREWVPRFFAVLRSLDEAYAQRKAWFGIEG